MKICSGKKAVIGGIIYAAVTFFAYVLFTIVLYYLLGGEVFVHKFETREVINGIPFIAVKTVAMIISAIIPVVMLKCKKLGYYGMVLCVATVTYGILFIIMYNFIYFSLAEIEVNLVAVNSFDSMVYGLWNFPLGAVIGILGKAVAHMLMKGEI